MANKPSPQLVEFEQELQALSIVEPSDDYFERSLAALALKDNNFNKKEGRQRRWLLPWQNVMMVALSLSLLLSLSVNVVQWFEQSSQKHQGLGTALNIANTNLENLNTVAENTETSFTLGKDFTPLNISSYLSEARFIDGAPAVEVSYIFWYGCYPCYAFERALSAWESTQAKNVVVNRMPLIVEPLSAANNNARQIHARAYLTALSFSKAEDIHRSLLQAISHAKSSYNNANDLAPIFLEHGVTSDQFLARYYSDEIDKQLQQVSQTQAAFLQAGVTATPALIINGRYLVNPGQFEHMLDVADYLIAQSACDQLSTRPGNPSMQLSC